MTAKVISEHGRVHQEPHAPGYGTSTFTGTNRLTIIASGNDTAYVPVHGLWKPGAINLGIGWQVNPQAGSVLTVDILGSMAPVELATSLDTGIQATVPWASIKSAAAENEAGIISIPFTVLKVVFSGAGVLFLVAA